MELIVLLLILSAAFFLAKNYYQPKFTGKLGEYRVSGTLSRLNKRDYIVYNDIYLENNGYTTQIDHLVLSIYGIFVIETKNYKGWIFGHEKSKYWTQTLYKKKFKLYNPVIQNWSHVNFLRRLSPNLRHVKYFPIVVFTGKSELKKITASIPVIKQRKLLSTIKRNKEVYITHGQLEKIDVEIRSSQRPGKTIKRKHIKNVKKKKADKHSDSKICPTCGGNLVIRHGGFGPFYGCSNYPTCKFTRNIRV